MSVWKAAVNRRARTRLRWKRGCHLWYSLSWVSWAVVNTIGYALGSACQYRRHCCASIPKHNVLKPKPPAQSESRVFLCSAFARTEAVYLLLPVISTCCYLSTCPWLMAIRGKAPRAASARASSCCSTGLAVLSCHFDRSNSDHL